MNPLLWWSGQKIKMRRYMRTMMNDILALGYQRRNLLSVNLLKWGYSFFHFAKKSGAVVERPFALQVVSVFTILHSIILTLVQIFITEISQRCISFCYSRTNVNSFNLSRKRKNDTLVWFYTLISIIVS